MTVIVAALAVAFAAFCVWLTVRYVNRRERWAKWTLAVVVGLPILYVASFGPVFRLNDEDYLPEWTWEAAQVLYYPVIWMAEYGPSPIVDSIWWYSDVWRTRREVPLYIE